MGERQLCRGSRSIGEHPIAALRFSGLIQRVMNDLQILPAPAPALARLRSQTNPPHRVLVVDDDDVMRRLNTMVLLRAGYAVDAAEDGVAAWEALCAESYDLMITDNNMPKMKGIEVLVKLRAARMALLVIMATGALPE